MISSNTRASRSASRYSSPAQPTNGGGIGSATRPLEASRSSVNEGSRSFMQRWLEPSVQSKPSFEEAGLVRFGVLENMAALGAMPKAKKAAAGESGTPTPRKIILKTPGTEAAKAAAAAAAAAPARDNLNTDDGIGSEEAVNSMPPLSPPDSLSFPSAPTTTKKRSLAGKIKTEVAEDAEDDEYDPKGTGNRRRRSRRVSLPVKRATAAATTTATTVPTTEQPLSRRRRSSASVIILKSTTPTKRLSRSEHEPQGFTDQVVAAAVEEALKHYRYPTAWALRSLYDEKSGDPEFVAMIEDVFSQTADAETLEEFYKQMEERKREGKKDNRGCYFFVPPATNSRFTPHKPMAAPYGDLIQLSEEPVRESRRATKKAKTSHDADAASATTPRERRIETAVASGGRARGIIRVKTPMSRKRARRDSGASDSSLSTALSMSSPEVRASSLHDSPTALRGTLAPRAAAATTTTTAMEESGGSGGASEPGPGPGPGPGGRRATTTSTTASTTKSAGAKSQPAPKPQPITSRGKSVAASKQVVSNSSRSNSPTLHPTSRTRSHKQSSSAAAADHVSMPGRVSAAELFPNLITKTIENSTAASAAHKDNSQVSLNGSGLSGAQAHMPEEDEDSFWDRRRDAQKVTNNFHPQRSFVRGGDAERETTPVRKSRRTRQSLAATIATRTTRSASKRPNEDDEGTVSPIPCSLPLPGDGSSSVTSRAATPTSLRPAKKQKSGLRVKSSPVKKKGGTAAGVPRLGNEGNSSSANGNAPKDPTADNDEYCSACGNTGDVVCCDGCPRSFHFECVDMVQSEDLPDEWFCNECLIRRYPSRVPIHKGIFGSALNNLEKSIPRAFSLPKRVQNRFEGVKAGADGDYEEVVSKQAKKRNGYDELPDFFKQREDGQAVLCHGCQKSATEIRSIIPCSVCPLYWHIDCLDPPLAVPPVLKTWRCPAHVDDVLIEVPSLAPAHRFRKLKRDQTISPAFGRGVRNNGHIEIDWADEPEEPETAGWPDYRSFGRTYKLPAKGVVLDFIEQLRNKGAGYGPRQSESKLVPYPSPPAQRDSASPLPGSALERKVEEMQVSLNLIGLQQKRSGGVDQLTSALLATADQNMLTLMAKSNADNIDLGQLTNDDKLGLRAMLAQMDAMSTRIRQVLGDDGDATPAPQALNINMKAEASSPVTESTCINDIDGDKIESLGPVTEPTPPSTVDHAECSMELD